MGNEYDSAEDPENGITSADKSQDGVLISNTTDTTAAKKRTITRKNSGGVITRKRRVRKSKEKEDVSTKCIKYAALSLLVGQMVGLVLLMRYSRTVPRPADQPLYLASTAVFSMEVMKLIICLFVVAYETGTGFFSELYHHTVGSPFEMLKLCVPSILYTVQNNLLYLALTNLDAATYQVCYQLKILTTAVFSAILLGRRFSPRKWVAVVILTIGVAVVQLSGSKDQHHDTEDEAKSNRNRWIGLIAVVCAACTSGFSGVYFGTSCEAPQRQHLTRRSFLLHRENSQRK